MNWTSVKGYHGFYQASDTGLVRTVARVVPFGNQFRTIKSKILRPNYRKDGYGTVKLCRKSKQRTHYIHRIVAEAWLPNPNDLRTINHRNFNKRDNCVENLEWCSHGSNLNHAIRNGRGRQKLFANDVRDIRKKYRSGESIREISRQYGVSWSCIGHIARNKNWAWLDEEKADDAHG